MQLTCPCCYTRFGIEAALQADAGRDLMALLAGMDAALARPLFAYLGLFRAAKTQLSWDRALRLAREVLALADGQVLAAALAETVTAMDEKRAQGAWKPLGNHNYLKRVIESTTARLEALPAAPNNVSVSEPRLPRSNTGRALIGLEAMKR